MWHDALCAKMNKYKLDQKLTDTNRQLYAKAAAVQYL